jgi:digalactosyldiacylglycerol synthase
MLGKVVWGKGFHELLQRVEEHNSSSEGQDFPLEMDVYGNGEDIHSVGGCVQVESN